MTRNQIEYWALKETERSNRSREAETNRANLAKEREDQRSHLAQENLTKRRDAETQRHNVSSEILQGLGISVDKQNAATREREAAAKEESNAIARDANRIREGELAVKQQDADTKRYDAITRTGNLGAAYSQSTMIGQDLGDAIRDSKGMLDTIWDRLAQPSPVQVYTPKVYNFGNNPYISDQTLPE